jgi:Ribbon-Helix-Helix transcriptional regulator family
MNHPCTIYTDGGGCNGAEILSNRASETEKITINRRHRPLFHFTRADLEAARAAGEKQHIKMLGLTSIAPDVLPAPGLATVESITVLGALHATEEIKTALADRIR